jgi:hypothetical protein
MKHRWLVIVGAVLPNLLLAQNVRSPQTQAGPFARIAVMRALDGHAVELEAGYIRHLEWHRQAKDTFGWYSYSVWASTERQRWIHAQFLGNGVYEFLPALSRGNGVPTPTLRAEYTTVELNYGTSKAFEAALAAEQSKLQGETLWYRMVVGGNTPRYVRLRPRATLAAILDERAGQALPDKVNALISKMTVESLNLRPNMLVNVTPEPAP